MGSLSPGGHPELLFFADVQWLRGHRGRTSLSKPRRGSKAVLLVQGLHVCSPALSQPQSLSTLSPPTLALRWDGWQLLCQGSLSRLSLIGCGKGYTDTVVKGSLEQQKFLIFYIR